MPFGQFIVKVHGRCNLACRYCYLYEGPDRTWRGRPAAAAPEVLDHAATRIAEHAGAHGLTALSLVLHGGEPLLVGAARLAAFAGLVRERAGRERTVHATVQTNATLLTERRIATLARHSIRVGVSLDGGRPEHNTLRTDHAGRPSWPAAARGVRLLAEHHPEAYAGILTVVDPRTEPVELYESLLELRPPAVDLLLPHGNWTAPPPGLPVADPPHRGPAADRPTPYGDWLSTVFDRWWSAGRRETRIRLFEECLALLLGLPAATESLGLDPLNAVVIETDGSIEQVDSLKSAYDGAAATGLDIFRHSFDDALTHPGVAARQSGASTLSQACRTCPLLSVCGGGNYAHRYREGDGFTHPSVYCADLARLIRHVAKRLTEATAPGAAQSGGARSDGARAGAGAVQPGVAQSDGPWSGTAGAGAAWPQAGRASTARTDGPWSDGARSDGARAGTGVAQPGATRPDGPWSGTAGAGAAQPGVAQSDGPWSGTAGTGAARPEADRAGHGAERPGVTRPPEAPAATGLSGAAATGLSGVAAIGGGVR